MWQCSSCSYTSCRAYNVRRHEKLKHQFKNSRKITVSKEGYKILLQKQCEMYSRGAYCCDYAPCSCPRRNKYVRVIDLDFLRLSTNINYLLSQVTEFLGCFSRNQLPPFPETFPKSMIINTDHSKGPGIHWVAIILLVDECLYFDPFGVSIAENEIFDYLRFRYRSFSYSNTCIQDIKSKKCGAFCVSYILSVKNKNDYNKFIAQFNATLLKQNDIILNRYFSEISIPV